MEVLRNTSKMGMSLENTHTFSQKLIQMQVQGESNEPLSVNVFARQHIGDWSTNTKWECISWYILGNQTFFLQPGTVIECGDNYLLISLNNSNNNNLNVSNSVGAVLVGNDCGGYARIIQQIIQESKDTLLLTTKNGTMYLLMPSSIQTFKT